MPGRGSTGSIAQRQGADARRKHWRLSDRRGVRGRRLTSRPPRDYEPGQLVLVQQRRSANGATIRRRETLATLGLGSPRDESVQVYEPGATAGLLEAVRDLIDHWALFDGEREMSVEPYEGLGGASAFIRLDEREQVRVDRQVDTYSLLWPTHRSLYRTLHALRALLPDDEADATIVVRDGRVLRLAGRDAIAALDGTEDATRAGRFARTVSLLRLDYPDRVLTWGRDWKDTSPADHNRRWHELGFLSSVYDEEYVRALLDRTATIGLKHNGRRVCEQASALLRDVRGHLGPDGAA